MRYENGWIFADGRFARGGFSVENGRFAHVLEDVPGPAEDLDGALVIPGLVDIHVHGCAGADFSDGDYAGLVRMARYLARRGVTSFAPASMTLPYDALDKAFHAAARLRREGLADGARLMGIQMEGPFLSREKRGSQNPAYLRLPDWDRFLRLYDAAEGLLRIVDVAPELPGAVEFTRRASEKCRVSVAVAMAVVSTVAAIPAPASTPITAMIAATAMKVTVSSVGMAMAVTAATTVAIPVMAAVAATESAADSAAMMTAAVMVVSGAATMAIVVLIATTTAGMVNIADSVMITTIVPTGVMMASVDMTASTMPAITMTVVTTRAITAMMTAAATTVMATATTATNVASSTVRIVRHITIASAMSTCQNRARTPMGR